MKTKLLPVYFFILLCLSFFCRADTVLVIPGKSIGSYSLNKKYNPENALKDTVGRIQIFPDSDGSSFIILSDSPDLKVLTSNLKIGDSIESVFKFYGKTHLSSNAEEKLHLKLYEYNIGIAFQVDDYKISAIAVMKPKAAEQDAAANP